MIAWRMATQNAAEWFGLDRIGLGAIAPGRRADLLVLADLDSVAIEKVFVDGQLIATDGRLEVELPEAPTTLPPSVHVDLDRFSGFAIPAEGEEVRVIEVIPGQIVTGHGAAMASVRDGEAVADPERDLCKIAVVERHGKSGTVGLGFVRGLGLRSGAIASSVGHDSHNIVIAGADDPSMWRALEEVVGLGGGLVVSLATEVLASLALPIAGLMSDLSAGSPVSAGSSSRGVSRAWRMSRRRLHEPVFPGPSRNPFPQDHGPRTGGRGRLRGRAAVGLKSRKQGRG